MKAPVETISVGRASIALPRNFEWGSSGEYIVVEQRDDGSVVVKPDTSMAAIRRRLGATPAKPGVRSKASAARPPLLRGFRALTAHKRKRMRPRADYLGRRTFDTAVGLWIRVVAVASMMLLMLCDHCALERGLAEGEIGAARPVGTALGRARRVLRGP
jgi:hypothetical protein